MVVALRRGDRRRDDVEAGNELPDVAVADAAVVDRSGAVVGGAAGVVVEAEVVGLRGVLLRVSDDGVVRVVRAAEVVVDVAERGDDRVDERDSDVVVRRALAGAAGGVVVVAAGSGTSPPPRAVAVAEVGAATGAGAGAGAGTGVVVARVRSSRATSSPCFFAAASNLSLTPRWISGSVNRRTPVLTSLLNSAFQLTPPISLGWRR